MGKYAVAANDERAFFNALNFNFTKECIEITATNGKVLFNEIVPIVGGEVIEGKEFSALVPRDEVNLLIRLMNHISEDTLKICMMGNRLYVNSNEISLILGLFNFSYPVVSHLIAQDPHTVIHVDRMALISAVKGVSSTRMVREYVELSMVIKEDGIYLSMKNDLCQGEDEIDISYFNGVPIQLIINYKYLLNTLYSLLDDEIRLDFCLEPVKTIKFFEKDTDLSVRLIAPFMLEPYTEQV